MSFRAAFGDFDDRVWLNCAHQGPLPLAAADAARQAIEWKLSPRNLTTARFTGVPKKLRQQLAQLIGAEADDVIPTNGASYGLHLLANGLPFDDGDEVLLMSGDFPSDILPWLGLRNRGVTVRLERPRDPVFSPEEIDELISARTRVLCIPWVHSFSGWVSDLNRIGEICRQHNVTLVANTSQGLGARQLDLSETPVEAIVNAGWKWLCGPYGTGFCWMHRSLRESLTHNQAYWLSTMTADDLVDENLDLAPPSAGNPRRYDLFAPANFFNFVPWSRAVEILLEFGTREIEGHDQALVQRFLDGLDRESYRVLSPEDPHDRSTLIFVSPRNGSSSAEIHRTIEEQGIDVALRSGYLRIAPHLYNTTEDIDRALDALHGAGDSAG
jgi:selenocysteine lyase/cysteine desulfurase